MDDNAATTTEIPLNQFMAYDFQPEKVLMQAYQIFVSGAIDESTTDRVCKSLVAMDYLNQMQDSEELKPPIVMRIWSPGGYITGGLSIIDTIRTLRTPVITMVLGQAASMASIVSICGDLRWITRNSSIMFHPMSGGIGFDYLPYQKDQLRHSESLDKTVMQLIIKHTKLGLPENKKYLDKMSNGEIWFNAREALKLGLVDKIVG